MAREYVEQRNNGYYVADSGVSLDSIVYAFRSGESPEAMGGLRRSARSCISTGSPGTSRTAPAPEHNRPVELTARRSKSCASARTADGPASSGDCGAAEGVDPGDHGTE